jgi:pimeloyl-ACP methyl ester carboxylesterase
MVLAAPGLSSYPYSAEFMEYIQNLLTLGDSGRTEEAIDTILNDPYWRLEEGKTAERTWLKQIMTENAHLFSWYLNVMHTDDKPLLPRLPDVKPETLLVVPQREYPDNLEVVNLLVSKLPAVRMLKVAGAGHFVTVDQPDVFNRETIQFIQNL